ncbi:MAG TPA: metallophosphoesterase family protein [Usitatibacter sp.]|nr:metallophosphoesterase family protein [Usitatibacter sp.]
MRVGLVSDTHGLLRPEALAALEGSDHIVHAGDIGDRAILEALAALAPLTAIRGNNDTGAWARKLRDEETLELGGVRIHVIHDLAALEAAPRGVRVVISGHSHVPRIVERDGVLCVNPGSAGPRRFRLPVSVGRLAIAKGRASAELVELAVAPPRRKLPRAAQ